MQMFLGSPWERVIRPPQRVVTPQVDNHCFDVGCKIACLGHCRLILLVGCLWIIPKALQLFSPLLVTTTELPTPSWWQDQDKLGNFLLHSFFLAPSLTVDVCM